MLYLVCSHSCMSQMEIPFLLNNSPDIRAPIEPDAHWAEYELNGENIDHEPGEFGKVRVHDDYWHLSTAGYKFYNHDIRNTMHISNEQLDGLYTFAKIKKNVALLIHAHNVDDVMKWADGKDVMVLTTAIGRWERDIEMWTMREFNYLMEDEHNANYSQDDHSITDINDVVDAFIHRMHVDRDWREKESDVLLMQTDWQRIPDIYALWDKVGLTPPPQDWIDRYIETFYAKQEFNVEKLVELRTAYESHEEYNKLI